MFHFKPTFRQALDLALSVYPDAQVGMDESGVTLKPSRPPVAPKAVPLRGLKAIGENGGRSPVAKSPPPSASPETVQSRPAGT